jgi:cytochrome c oxidase cbb3-type subunit III
MLAASPGYARDDSDRARTGEGVYRRHCMQCHGPEADGRGIHAKRFNPPPSDLAHSPRTDDYRLQIITVGGEAMGRSSVMPEWGLELSGQDILDVVVYLRRVSDQAAARAKADKSGASAVARRRRAHG